MDPDDGFGTLLIPRIVIPNEKTTSAFVIYHNIIF